MHNSHASYTLYPAELATASWIREQGQPEVNYGLILQNEGDQSSSLYQRVTGQLVRYSLEEFEYRNTNSRLTPKPTVTQVTDSRQRSQEDRRQRREQRVRIRQSRGNHHLSRGQCQEKQEHQAESEIKKDMIRVKSRIGDSQNEQNMKCQWQWM